MQTLPRAMSGALAAKLGVCIVAGAATAAGLLSARQERIHAVNELSMSIQRRAQGDKALWALRLEIAERTSPQGVARLLEGDERPILRDWCPPLIDLESDRQPLILADRFNPNPERSSQ